MSIRPNIFLRSHKDASTYTTLLKSHILDLLPTAYLRHSSTHALKGFAIRVTINKTFYAAIAIAELSLPPSLIDPFEGDMYEAMVLEDEFVEARNGESAVEALEMLCDEVEAMVENKGNK
ncbi:hypothetical protein DE146DRAFT_750271 [Phaeosphaeria sp. MPI-PUGE-AT-0046c]|nr:hypothetical protein DE146DRAFT_750271 [Phaeosphaeria sp. MPI-PUGE-AT-0046c]